MIVPLNDIVESPSGVASLGTCYGISPYWSAGYFIYNLTSLVLDFHGNCKNKYKENVSPSPNKLYVVKFVGELHKFATHQLKH